MALSRLRSGYWLLLLGAGLVAFSAALHAQQTPAKPLTWRSFIRHIGEDQKGIWLSPFHSGRKEAKSWLLFGSATAGLIASDKWTSKQLPNTPDQIAVSRITAKFGAAYTLAPGVVALYAAGAARGDERLRETGLLGAEALVDAILVSNALKVATWRERPLEGYGSGRFWNGSGRFWDSGASFPSGHSTQVWAVASVVAHEYPRPRIIPIAAYGVAGTVMASRFAQRKHFASDVVAGAAIGWFIGHYVFHKRHNRSLDTR